eukprot:117977-Pyramimonas_sp.AAC.1
MSASLPLSAQEDPPFFPSGTLARTWGPLRAEAAARFASLAAARQVGSIPALREWLPVAEEDTGRPPAVVGFLPPKWEVGGRMVGIVGIGKYAWSETQDDIQQPSD